MKQSGHLYPSEETGTGCPVTSKYERTPPNKHGVVDRQQQQHQVMRHVMMAKDEYSLAKHLPIKSLKQHNRQLH